MGSSEKGMGAVLSGSSTPSLHRLSGWRESLVAGKGTDQAWSCWRQRPAADHGFLHPQVIPDSEGHPRVVAREVCMGIWSRQWSSGRQWHPFSHFGQSRSQEVAAGEGKAV